MLSSSKDTLFPLIFNEFLKTHPDFLKSTIVFVETKEYGNRILEILHDYTHLYRTYYSEDDRNNLAYFGRGEIDCLITCHRLSQGIDIKKIKNIVLFSSARSKLETIQRIGRCLRVDPDSPQKKAIVLDFILESSDEDIYSADNIRYSWLIEISKAKRIE